MRQLYEAAGTASYTVSFTPVLHKVSICGAADANLEVWLSVRLCMQQPHMAVGAASYTVSVTPALHEVRCYATYVVLGTDTARGSHLRQRHTATAGAGASATAVRSIGNSGSRCASPSSAARRSAAEPSAARCGC
jgi:hypothetical protein